MSFYTKIQTELSNKRYLLLALESLKKKGEISAFVINERKNTVEVDRDGDLINIIKEKAGNFNVAGDARVVRVFSDRLKQAYAYESIKENLPLDFEIAKESETVDGEIVILLKG
ncbi:MAG: hypothetical protein HY887_05250 [Deltaproteobacteria bacterium]|nr:hypothetical protein [Deltaproteobacteria bacterium]